MCIRDSDSPNRKFRFSRELTKPENRIFHSVQKSSVLLLSLPKLASFATSTLSPSASELTRLTGNSDFHENSRNAKIEFSTLCMSKCSTSFLNPSSSPTPRAMNTGRRAHDRRLPFAEWKRSAEAAVAHKYGTEYPSVLEAHPLYCCEASKPRVASAGIGKRKQFRRLFRVAAFRPRRPSSLVTL